MAVDCDYEAALLVRDYPDSRGSSGSAQTVANAFVGGRSEYLNS
jgi:hypothetical protein